jgi:hypothetical protein
MPAAPGSYGLKWIALHCKLKWPTRVSPGLAGGGRGRRTLRGQILHPGQGGLRL